MSMQCKLPSPYIHHSLGPLSPSKRSQAQKRTANEEAAAVKAAKLSKSNDDNRQALFGPVSQAVCKGDYMLMGREKHNDIVNSRRWSYAFNMCSQSWQAQQNHPWVSCGFGCCWSCCDIQRLHESSIRCGFGCCWSCCEIQRLQLARSPSCPSTTL